MLGSPYPSIEQQYQELSDDIRLVILHPNYPQQHLALDAILSQPGAVYVRLQGARLSEDDFEAQLSAALASATPPARLETVSVLVLDEVDRVQSDVLACVLPDLVLKRTRGRVVLGSRLVPQAALENADLRRCARFIPADPSLMLWDYAQHDGSSGALLEVRALGLGHVLLNGRPIDSWDGLLPRSLFFYLVDRGMTTRGEIFQTFWPNLTTREATNVFHVTKRKISEVLGIDLTVYWSGFYHISPRIHLSYDAALFSETVQDSAVIPPEEAAVLLRRAIALYRGDFLSTINMPWTQKRRYELLQTYGEALVGLAKITERRNDVRQSLGYYLRAATTNRQREDLVHSIMRLYRDLGMPDDALAVYRHLEDELKHQLGVSPAQHLQELSSTIQADIAAGRSAGDGAVD